MAALSVARPFARLGLGKSLDQVASLKRPKPPSLTGLSARKWEVCIFSLIDRFIRRDYGANGSYSYSAQVWDGLLKYVDSNYMYREGYAHVVEGENPVYKSN